MNNTADVIIIGGGIHGASTAFHLAARGIKTLVIEKNTLALAATGRSSGLVRMHYDLEPESRLAWESFQYFRDWDERVGGGSSTSLSSFRRFPSSSSKASRGASSPLVASLRSASSRFSLSHFTSSMACRFLCNGS